MKQIIFNDQKKRVPMFTLSIKNDHYEKLSKIKK